VRPSKLRFLTLCVALSVTAGLLGSLVGCTSPATPTSVDATVSGSRNNGDGESRDDLSALEPGDFNAIHEHGIFCEAIRSHGVDGSITFEALIATYRDALLLAPPEISNELSALLDFLEFGIEPDYGELPAAPTPAPSSSVNPVTEGNDDSAAEGVESEPTDPYVFVTPNSEQLALSVAEFLETHCRGVALSPLPPPTAPNLLAPD
jgi:hypothetical protein